MTDITSASKLNICLVIPVFNEEEAVNLFHQELIQAVDGLPYDFKILYVNDGSNDATQPRLEELARQDERITILELSRNFGHQAALTAGLDAAEGDYVITMDGDGQHPPVLLGELIRLAQNGYDIVLTQRLEQQNLPIFKRWTSNLFYTLVNRIGDTHVIPGAADFRLMAMPVVEALRSMREYQRFIRGMVSWEGFRTVILPYQPADRLAGQSKYSLKKMVKLASDAIFSFSLVPIYLSLSIGGLFLLLALIEVIYVLNLWLGGHQSQLAPGWSSLMFMLLVVGGSLMVSLGIIGLYIGNIFQEVKRRPIYITRTVVHFSSPSQRK
jgi:polyisoprenyl-phosphate glycosyltransferase